MVVDMVFHLAVTESRPVESSDSSDGQAWLQSSFMECPGREWPRKHTKTRSTSINYQGQSAMVINRLLVGFVGLRCCWYLRPTGCVVSYFLLVADRALTVQRLQQQPRQLRQWLQGAWKQLISWQSLHQFTSCILSCPRLLIMSTIFDWAEQGLQPCSRVILQQLNFDMFTIVYPYFFPQLWLALDIFTKQNIFKPEVCDLFVNAWWAVNISNMFALESQDMAGVLQR